MSNNSHFVWLLNQIASLAAVNANAQEAILAAEYMYYIVCVCVCVYNGPHYAHKELERERGREIHAWLPLKIAGLSVRNLMCDLEGTTKHFLKVVGAVYLP